MPDLRQRDARPGPVQHQRGGTGPARPFLAFPLQGDELLAGRLQRRVRPGPLVRAPDGDHGRGRGRQAGRERLARGLERGRHQGFQPEQPLLQRGADAHGALQRDLPGPLHLDAPVQQAFRRGAVQGGALAAHRVQVLCRLRLDRRGSAAAGPRPGDGRAQCLWQRHAEHPFRRGLQPLRGGGLLRAGL